MALERLLVVDVVRQHHDAARRIHDVVVQILRQVFPELQRMLVDVHALFIEIVGPDDRGVATGIAAADPTLFEHRDIGDAVLLGEVIGRTEAMATTADDDRIILFARLRRRPLRRPPLVAAQRLARHGEN
ncbi:hypothetical protein D9M70_418460 [compost metagenome]